MPASLKSLVASTRTASSTPSCPTDVHWHALAVDFVRMGVLNHGIELDKNIYTGTTGAPQSTDDTSPTLSRSSAYVSGSFKPTG